MKNGKSSSADACNVGASGGGADAATTSGTLLGAGTAGAAGRNEAKPGSAPARGATGRGAEDMAASGGRAAGVTRGSMGGAIGAATAAPLDDDRAMSGGAVTGND